MQWYYSLNAQRIGPVAASEFEALVQAGTIKAETLVWHEGMANWVAYSQLSAADRSPDTAAADDGTAVCVVSGKRYPKREMIQYEGKWVSAEHRDEFFQRLREGVALPGGGPVPGPFGYGGFWLRAGAVILDGIIVGVPNAILGAMLAVAMGPSGAEQGLAFLIGTAIAICYEVFFIRRFDATPGKMVVGLKILRTDGGKLSVGRIIGRYFGKLLSAFTLSIGYLMAAFDDEKRALHDRICDTRVIKTR